MSYFDKEYIESEQICFTNGFAKYLYFAILAEIAKLERMGFDKLVFHLFIVLYLL